MKNRPQQAQKNSDKRNIAIVIAVLFILLCAQLTFDQWSKWGLGDQASVPMGQVKDLIGSLQVRSSSNSHWSEASVRDTLFLHQELMTGSKSTAGIRLGSLDIKLHSSTELKVRKVKNRQAFELNRGSYTIRLPASTKAILLFPGVPIVEITTRQDSEFYVVSGPDGKPLIQVIQGDLESRINGQNLRLGLFQTWQPRAGVNRLDESLVFTQPGPDAEFSSTDGLEIDFRWSLPGWKPAYLPKITFQMSEEPRFEKPFLSQDLPFQNHFKTRVQGNREFYYRLIDPEGRISPIQRVQFYELQEPKLAVKTPDLTGPLSPEEMSLARIRVERETRSTDSWIQISQDVNFSTSFVSERTAIDEVTKTLPPGEYWVRAKAMYPNQRESNWSSPVFFEMPTTEVLGWPFKMQIGVLIDSAKHPAEWIQLSELELQQKLQKTVAFQRLFEPLTANLSQDETVEVESSLNPDPVSVMSGHFPAGWIEPGKQTFRYRKSRGGFKGQWSRAHPFTVGVAPPRWRDQTLPLAPQSDGSIRSHSVAWTPLLFASEYEIESWSSKSTLAKSSRRNLRPSMIVTVPQGESRVVRVRGIGRKGQVISAWSDPLILNPPISIPMPLAKVSKKVPLTQNSPMTQAKLQAPAATPKSPQIVRNFVKPNSPMQSQTPALGAPASSENSFGQQTTVEEIAPQTTHDPTTVTEADRLPAQENQLSLKLDRWTAHGFPFKMWSWFGSGVNYVSYQQQVTGKAILDFTETAGPSYYSEVGGIHSSGFGAIASFKQTPGTVQIEDAPIDERNYTWSSSSVDILNRSDEIVTLGGTHFSYAGLLGVQHHSIPYVQFVPGNTFALKKVSLLNASLGFLTQISRGKWRYEWTMRYQYPLFSTGTGGTEFSAQPVLTFDGLVGASYQLLSKWRVGAFFYGQLHNYQFEARSDQINYSGDQSLFYSNIDLRLGYEF